MRKLAIVLFLFSLLAVSCTTGISQEEYDKVSSDLTQAQQELETTQLALTNTLAELRAVEEDLSGVRQELDAVEGRLAEAEGEMEQLEAELDLYKELGISVRSGKQPPHNHIINNRNAVNPTWQQLTSFIFADRTDEKPYIEDVFMCGDFAEEVHNNAESAGIRAAYVRVKFEGDEVSHALNAFITSDKGLVYVDCTGCEEPTCDAIAYVDVGKELGATSLGENTPLDYEHYESVAEALDAYSERVEAYNREVEEYNRYIDGKVFYIGTPEWRRVTDWYDRLQRESEALDREREQLETVRKPMGIVSSIEIYW